MRALLVASLIVAGCTTAVGAEDVMQDPGADDSASPADDAEPIDGDPDDATGSDSRPATDTGAADTGVTAGGPIATGLTITQVALLQGSTVTLAKGSAKASPRKDIVAGRAGLMRVFVAPKPGFAPHAITGELSLESSSGMTKLTAAFTPSAASTEASLTSTLNFEIATDAIRPDTAYSVTLYDTMASGSDTSGARYPASGVDSLNARATGTLKIVLVPFRYDADGSGRLPDTTAAQVERYRQAFYGMYPAQKVEVTVHAPYPWSSAITPSGSSFSTALTAMQKLRISDGVAKNVYYHGIFTPSSSFSTYCAGSCVTGLCGMSSSPSDSTVRACVGIGYTGSNSTDTAVQEIGHAHGRNHAPCGVSGADPGFPYSGASIGTYGYDLSSKALLAPTKYKDLMSYCQPYWVSDYTFQALLERMAYLNTGAFEITLAATSTRYRYIYVAADGTLTAGEHVDLDGPPVGEPRALTVESNGARRVVMGAYYPYDQLPGGYLLVPDDHVDVPVKIAPRLGRTP